MIGSSTAGSGITRVWAWSDRSIYNTRSALVERAHKLGLTDVCLCGNSIRSGDTPLATRARMSATTRALQDLGIAVHVLWFPTPTVAACTRAGEVLADMANSLQLRSTMLDLEENWTQHRRPEFAPATAAFFAAYRGATSVPVGVTGIPYHSPSKLGAAIAECDYVATQGYSSTVQNQVPGRIQRLAHDRWRGYGKPVIAGVAAYKQAGAGGMTARRAFQTAVDAVRALSEPRVAELAIWSLGDLRPNTDVRAIVLELTAALPR